MTDIKSAIEHYRDVCVQMGQYPESNTYRYAELSIRSLQAWSEVVQELEGASVFADKCDDTEEASAYRRAIDIINQHLAEIEE